MAWILVWLQVTAGMPVEHYQLDTFGSRTLCEQYRQVAQVLVADNDMSVVCLSVDLADVEKDE